MVMMYVRFRLSLRNVGDLPFDRGIDSFMRSCGSGFAMPRHGCVALLVERFSPLFAADIRRHRVNRMKAFGKGSGISRRCP